MPGRLTVASRYTKNRDWALSLAGPCEEDQILALVALWVACREYTDGDFRAYARARIEDVLQPLPQGV